MSGWTPPEVLSVEQKLHSEDFWRSEARSQNGVLAWSAYPSPVAGAAQPQTWRGTYQRYCRPRRLTLRQNQDPVAAPKVNGANQGSAERGDDHTVLKSLL